jgi:uncharacterized membrane protein HdeD (DUF308 family)
VILAKNWWSLVIRGVVALSLGVLTAVWPHIRVETLALVFLAYALIDGLVGIAGAVRAAEAHERWGALLFEGLTGIVTAIAIMLWPAIGGLSLIYVIAVWAFVTGAFEIIAGVRLRKLITGEWLLLLSGAASLILGVLMIAAALAGSLAVEHWISAYAIVFGVLLVGLGFRLRSWVTPPHADAQDRSALRA